MILYTLTNFQASKTLRMEVALFNFPFLFQTVFIVSCSRLMWPWKKKTLRWNQFVYIITHSWLLFHHLVLYRSCLLLWNPYPPGEAQYLVDLGINLSSNFEPIFSPTGFGPYFPPSPEILHCTLKMASQPKLWNNNNLLNFKVNTSLWKSVCKTGTKKKDLIIWQPVFLSPSIYQKMLQNPGNICERYYSCRKLESANPTWTWAGGRRKKFGLSWRPTVAPA